MSIQEHIGSSLHHTYFIEGEAETVVPDFQSFLSGRGIAITGNPNILVEEYEAVTMDHIPLLKKYQSERGSASAVGGYPETKIIIVSARSINHDAGHALLKLLEEPAADTHFFFIVSAVDILPATLLSRAHVIRSERNTEETFSLAKKFLGLAKKDRLDFVAEFVSSRKDNDTSAPLRSDAQMLLNQCEALLHASSKNLSTETIWKFEELIKMKKYLSTSGASVKMILEHLALVL